MKSFKFIALCLCALLASVYFISCDKDDDETNNSIVGTWDASEIDNGFYFMFCDNGIGYMFNLEEQEIGHVTKFSYSHNASSGALTVTEAEYEIVYSWNANVNGNTMELKMSGVSMNKTITLKRATVKATRDGVEAVYQKELL